MYPKFWKLLALDWINKILTLLANNCKGGDSCCSSGNKCKDWDGDCDTNEECLSGLCGDNNCDPQMFDTFDSSDDCCIPTNGNSTETKYEMHLK